MLVLKGLSLEAAFIKIAIFQLHIRWTRNFHIEYCASSFPKFFTCSVGSKQQK